MADTILIVDDEETVRRTFAEWLTASGWPVTVRIAGDAEQALKIANAEPIDLAILDWNLGSGSDGLQLLEDLAEFQPDIVAILVTGYASQATPLDALRRGVRDYLDKNHDLTRDTFLVAVKKQLDALAPAKRQRTLQKQLQSFRDAVATAVPLVRDTQAWNTPRPLPAAIRSLLAFALRSTGSANGAMVFHALESNMETLRVFDAEGQPLTVPALPFGRTIAANVLAGNQPQTLSHFTDDAALKLFAIETQHAHLLAIPFAIRDGVRGVLELFRDTPFDNDAIRVAKLVSEIGTELLRHALAERQTHRLLHDALAGALAAGDAVTDVLSKPASQTQTQMTAATVEDDSLVLDLVHAIRTLSDKHGEPAVKHALDSIRALITLLDTATS